MQILPNCNIWDIERQHKKFHVLHAMIRSRILPLNVSFVFTLCFRNRGDYSERESLVLVILSKYSGMMMIMILSWSLSISRADTAASWWHLLHHFDVIVMRQYLLNNHHHVRICRYYCSSIEIFNNSSTTFYHFSIKQINKNSSQVNDHEQNKYGHRPVTSMGPVDTHGMGADKNLLEFSDTNKRKCPCKLLHRLTWTELILDSDTDMDDLKTLSMSKLKENSTLNTGHFMTYEIF